MTKVSIELTSVPVNSTTTQGLNTVVVRVENATLLDGDFRIQETTTLSNISVFIAQNTFIRSPLTAVGMESPATENIVLRVSGNTTPSAE